MVTGVKAEVTRRISSKSRARVALHLDSARIGAEVGAARKLSAHSSAGFSVAISLQARPGLS
eukprot:2457641-Pyramimonas_sp.AAC.1